MRVLSAGKKLSLQKKARQVFGRAVLFDELLSKHTTFKIGGPAFLFFKAPNLAFLKKIINFCQKNKIKIFIIGSGSNLLVRDQGFRGAVIKLEGDFQKIALKGKATVEAGAGATLPGLAKFSESKNLSGLEWAAQIPASCAGALRSNAGAFGASMADITESLTVLDTRTKKIKKLSRKELGFSYRNCRGDKNYLIISAVLKLKKKPKKEILARKKQMLATRQKSQPLNLPSAGCIFKNPPCAGITARASAGRLIEKCGLKGYQIGAARISDKHANFIVNSGGAKARDVLKLIKLIQKKVKEKFGVNLKLEIIIL